MIIIDKFYNKEKQYTQVQVLCESCNKIYTLRNSSLKKRKYEFCHDCYQKSSQRKLVSKKIVANRKSFNGENNPNYRGYVEITCKCNKIFKVNQFRKNSAKYCSNECRYKFNISKKKSIIYNNIKFSSTWEVEFAKYLDECKYTWRYEPEAFKTPFGYYNPDFFVNDWDCYVEVKGYFRDDAKDKFDYFSKTNLILLFDKNKFKEFNIRVK